MPSTNIDAPPAHSRIFLRFIDFMRPIVEPTSAWIATCADYYAAAAMYEQLSGLSNAELERRGHSRATLARDICVKCDRTNIR
jgi:hypothetical protein